jgi:hypothetical protein
MIPLSEIGAVLPVNPWKLEIKVLMYKNKNVDNKYSTTVRKQTLFYRKNILIAI